MNPIKVIVIGAGDRGNAYSRYALNHPFEIKIVGVAEPDDKKRELFSNKFNIPAKFRFKDYKEVFSIKKFADAVIITTQDRLHFKPAVMALENDYHILLEKPISNNPYEIIELERLAKNYKKIFMICHVLRYTSFFRAIKEIIDSSELGKIVAIQHNENIGHIHFSHSFVRGNWRNSDLSSPIILAKSCHDMDLLLWFTGSKVKQVSAFGSLSYFNSKNMPKGAPKNCLDGCPVETDCPYSAIKIYLKNDVDWFPSVVTTDTSIEGRIKSLKNGNYGRCVFQCDNNVPDHLVSNIEFENGITASFVLSALTFYISRTLKIMGTKGELRADTTKNEIEIREFRTNNIKKISAGTIEGFHYGGDTNIIKEFIKAIRERTSNTKVLTSLSESVESHLLAFAVEESRIKNKTINYGEYVKRILLKK